MLFKFTASNCTHTFSSLRTKSCSKSWHLVIFLNGECLHIISNRLTSSKRLVESLPRQFHQDLLGLRADILHEVAFASRNPFKKIRPKNKIFRKICPVTQRLAISDKLICLGQIIFFYRSLRNGGESNTEKSKQQKMIYKDQLLINRLSLLLSSEIK